MLLELVDVLLLAVEALLLLGLSAKRAAEVPQGLLQLRSQLLQGMQHDLIQSQAFPATGHASEGLLINGPSVHRVR